ncbi:MAG: AAA family ATPase [Fimbriimonadaceae bacterium]|nr:AAA family ATPase [Chitinophagales bacterium]
MRIYLIGFMGCGKSTAGKKLAAKMSLPLMDLDKTMEDIEGKKVSEVFAEKGETYFRNLEKDVLHDTTFYTDAIISCGGGTPCFFDNLQWMKQNGVTVYLKATPDFLFSRLKEKKAKRPLIANMDDIELLKYIKTKLSDREKYYLQADIIVQAQDLDVDVLISIIRNYLK